MGDKSIKEEQNFKNLPSGSLFSHVIGQIDDDNKGISGIEKHFDYELKSSSKELSLSLDTNIQHLIRKELINYRNIFNYTGSAVLLVNIHTGEILSLLSMPDFDLNKRQNISDEKYINRATKALFEFGSVFKTFTYAAALEKGVIEKNTQFNNLEKIIVENSIGEYDDEIPSNLIRRNL